MTCKCRLCLQIREHQKHLDILREAGLDDSVTFYEEIYEELTEISMDNDVHKAIIEGSWPTADENIKTARDRFKLAREETA